VLAGGLVGGLSSAGVVWLQHALSKKTHLAERLEEAHALSYALEKWAAMHTEIMNSSGDSRDARWADWRQTVPPFVRLLLLLRAYGRESLGSITARLDNATEEYRKWWIEGEAWEEAERVGVDPQDVEEASAAAHVPIRDVCEQVRREIEDLIGRLG